MAEIQGCGATWQIEWVTAGVLRGEGLGIQDGAGQIPVGRAVAAALGNRVYTPLYLNIWLGIQIVSLSLVPKLSLTYHTLLDLRNRKLLPDAPMLCARSGWDSPISLSFHGRA